MTNALRTAYRFRPARTAAQALGASLAADGFGLLETNFPEQLSLAGMAGLIAFLMIWGEGGQMLADDERVTGTAQVDG
jgi:hypothetical protein